MSASAMQGGHKEVSKTKSVLT